MHVTRWPDLRCKSFRTSFGITTWYFVEIRTWPIRFTFYISILEMYNIQVKKSSIPPFHPQGWNGRLSGVGGGFGGQALAPEVIFVVFRRRLAEDEDLSPLSGFEARNIGRADLAFPGKDLKK